MPRFQTVAVIFLLTLCTVAKDQPAQVMTWPESGTPIVRFSFGKFKGSDSIGKEKVYVTETTAENLWNKTIPSASFSLYLFDKNKVRIGEGWISLSNVAPGQTVKFQTTLQSSGTPISVSLAPRQLPAELRSFLPARIVSITVNSVPQGAAVKVDGSDAGTTPKMLQVSAGKHLLEFSKEGFNSGKFPLEIGPDDVSGGSVSFELGTSVHDTIELRDGSVLNGDLESVSASDIVVRVGGNMQRYSRNQVRRILLIERDTPQASKQ